MGAAPAGSAGAGAPGTTAAAASAAAALMSLPYFSDTDNHQHHYQQNGYGISQYHRHALTSFLPALSFINRQTPGPPFLFFLCVRGIHGSQASLALLRHITLADQQVNDACDHHKTQRRSDTKAVLAGNHAAHLIGDEG